MPKQITTPQIEADNLDPQRLAQAGQASKELATIYATDARNASDLAVQLNYNGSLEPDALEQVAKNTLVALQQGIFAFGATLLLLRESCLHGDWQHRLDRIGVSRPVAHRYMSIAAKFRSTSTAKSLETLGLGKLLELTVLEDDEIQAFADGETVHGVTIDAVDRLSVKELRKKLRETSDKLTATEAWNKEKSAQIEATEIKLALAKPTEEEILAHKTRPLYELVAAAGLLSEKLEKAVGVVLDEQDSLLKDEAFNALTLITKYMLRAADKNYMPLDMEAIGLDMTVFETKALGLGALDAAE